MALEFAAGRPELFPVAKTFDLAEVGKAAAFVEMPGRTGTALLSSR
ncbi:hypothetical protein [Azospirillum endophyticum]